VPLARAGVAAALFVRDILCGRLESAYIADLMRRKRNARLMDFYHICIL
jgi:hypothetical protein